MVIQVCEDLDEGCVDRRASEGELEHGGVPWSSYTSDNCSHNFPLKLEARDCDVAQLED